MKKALLVLIVVSSLLTLFIFTPYSLRIKTSLPNSIDPVFYAWNLMHNYTSAAHGFKNLLDTNIFYPERNTLALSDTLFAQTVFVSPILALTHNPVLAENLYILATFPLAAVSMFFLCLYLTKSPWASALSGIFYAFSIPRIGQIGHIPALSSQWLPLVFLFLIRWIREGKFRYLFSMFFFFLLSITSTVYFAIFLIPLAPVIIFFELKKERVFTIFRQLLILLVPAIIILGIVLFPYIRLRMDYPGIRRSLDDAARLSATPIDYLSVLPTSWLADIGFPTNTNERALFPTFTLIILAIMSLRKINLSFFLLAIFAGILSLGPYFGTVKLPYYYLYKIFPLLESIRVPARFSIFVILGLSVFASYTIAKLEKRKELIIIIFLIFLTEVWQTNTPSVPIPTEIPAVYQYIERTPDDTIILELPLHPVWLSTLMENQLYLSYEDLTENDVYALEAYRTYFSAFHRKRILNGYSGYFPTVYNDHASVFDKFPTPDAIATLEKRKVKYILVHSDDIARKIRAYPRLKPVGQFGADYLYSL